MQYGHLLQIEIYILNFKRTNIVATCNIITKRYDISKRTFQQQLYIIYIIVKFIW